MGSSVSVPGPSQEERDLQRNQAELLALQRQIIEEQRTQNRIILPFLAQQEGFNVTTDDHGNVTSVSMTPQAQADKDLQSQITRALNQRSLDALAGNLPVDPGLERDLTTQEAELRNKLALQLGPGYETSTPGIQALDEFRKTADELRYGARTGQLTLAEQLGITREQQNQFSRQSSEDVLRTSAIGDPLTFAGAFGQTAKGYGQAQVPFIQQRQMQLQASIANAQSSNALFGAGIGAIGAFFSDEDGKADPVLVTHLPSGIPIYEYTHKGTGERMIGVMARDVEHVRPGAVVSRLGRDAVVYRELH